VPQGVQPDPAAFPHEVHHDVLLSTLTTLAVGGPARRLVVPHDAAELAFVVGSLWRCGERVFLLGAGSNVLFSDAGFDGTVVLTTHVDNYRLVGGAVQAECGVRWTKVLADPAIRDAGTLDFLAGIPGTVGGGVIVNAGIPERSVADVVTRVHVLDRGGRTLSLPPCACGFRYRGSRLADDAVLVLEARFTLSGRPFHRGELIPRRLRTQPVHASTAGCVFKNPPGVSAGALIERAGLKGRRVGEAEISSVHANFIVNRGGATAAEIRRLIDIARRKVYKEYRVLLELEIEVVDG
jgi:UDP-N-acetylmuramate dehydrogenase